MSLSLSLAPVKGKGEGVRKAVGQMEELWLLSSQCM